MNKNVKTITSSHTNSPRHQTISFLTEIPNYRNYVLCVWSWNINTSSTTLRCTIMCVCVHVKLLPALSRFRASGRATDGVMVTQGPMPKPRPPRTSKNTHTHKHTHTHTHTKRRHSWVLCGKHGPEGLPDLEWLSQTIAHLWCLYPDKRRYRHS